jgi:trigger factor
MGIMGMDENSIKEQFKERAEKDVKVQLVLEKISEVEKIVPSEEDLEAEFKKLAESYRKSEEEFKKLLKEDDIEYIKRDLTIGKTVDFLVTNAKIV